MTTRFVVMVTRSPCTGFSRSSNRILGILGVVCLLLQTAQASWWYLGLPMASNLISDKTLVQEPSNETCNDLDFLTPHQKRMCNADVQILTAVGRGAAMAIQECQRQFEGRRWNCTIYNHKNVFGTIPATKTYESAFVHAITSAGVAYAVTKACARGELKDCGCDPKPKIPVDKAKAAYVSLIKTDGCSDDTRYGRRFSKRFLDPMEKGRSPNSLMNVWNNDVGRKIISTNMKMKCRCHGKSCSIKTCWMRMKSFRYVGKTLAKSDALPVFQDPGENVLVAQTELTKHNLVYLEKSPNYCDLNPEQGSLGTSGRQCNATTNGPGGCEYLCCGRGYYNRNDTVVERCNCTFVWCCHVKCDSCVRKVENTYCK